MNQEGSDKGSTRRRFMQIAGAAAAAAIAAPPGAEQLANTFAEGAIEQQKTTLIKHLQQRYSRDERSLLQIDLKASQLPVLDRGFKGGDVEVEHINSAMAELVTLQNLTDVLSKYPPELVQQNINRIGIASGLVQQWLLPLHVKGIAERHTRTGEHRLLTTIHSLAFSANLPTNILRPYFVALGKTLRENTTHHEIGHLLLWMEEDQSHEWTRLNPPGFTYPGPMISKLDVIVPGFARGYGHMSYNEDVATVFDSMMTDYRGLMSRVNTTKDEVLANKIAYVKNKLANADPRMTEKYWRDLSDNHVSESYWAS